MARTGKPSCCGKKRVNEEQADQRQLEGNVTMIDEPTK
jgi:hypothetical protein